MKEAIPLLAVAEPLILALDIGNGSIKLARFEQGRRLDARRLPLDATPEAAETIVAVSVNPPVLARLREALPAMSVVGEDLEPGIDVSYDSCGLDRVMGVVGGQGAKRVYQEG